MREAVDAYRAELRALSSDELAARYSGARESEATALRLAAEREEQGRFFNQPWSTADFDHWSKAAHWTLDEALALSFGKAPERVNWERVKPHVGVSPFAFQYGRRRDLALRAVQWQQLYDPVLPGIFLAWAKRNEFVLPEKLGAAVAARGVKVGDWQSLYEELAASLENQGQQWLALSRSKDELISALERRLSEQCPETLPEKALSTRERDSLLKLVIGMAVGGYGHDPKAKRSGQCAAIADDLAKTGVPLDVDTVRKWLREASDLLPGD
jgi:hypothetical protein